MAEPAPRTQLIAAMVAVKQQLAGIYTDWCVRGPKLEASTAITAMAQEEQGHARVLSGLLETASTSEALPCLGRPLASWPEMVGSAGPADVALARLTRALATCPDPALQARLRKMADEERFHEAFYQGWFALLETDEPAVARIFWDARIRAEAEVVNWLGNLDALATEAGLAPAGTLRRACAPGTVRPQPVR